MVRGIPLVFASCPVLLCPLMSDLAIRWLASRTRTRWRLFGLSGGRAPRKLERWYLMFERDPGYDTGNGSGR